MDISYWSTAGFPLDFYPSVYSEGQNCYRGSLGWDPLGEARDFKIFGDFVDMRGPC